MSKQLEFNYDIVLEFDCNVKGHSFALRCIPPSFPGQKITDVMLALDPPVPYSLQQDSFGNLLQIGRIEAPHDHFHYSVHGTAIIDTDQRKPEAAHPIFRFPTPYTAMSPSMTAFLSRLSLPDIPSELAWTLCKAVGSHMQYRPGATNVSTTAAQAFDAGAGVCQDFAHVYLALARASGLTARYVSGLPSGEGASHAWCEVWLNGIWTGIDPTRQRWADNGYIRFNVGRDFQDCPMERGIFSGLTDQRQTVFMRVTEQ